VKSAENAGNHAQNGIGRIQGAVKRYAITGVRGKVGGAAARALLDAGHAVRAVLRDKKKAAKWE